MDAGAETPPAAPPRPRTVRLWATALGATLGAGALAIVSGASAIALGATGPRGSVGTAWAAVGLLAIPAVARLARRVAGPGALTAASLGALGLVPVVFFTALAGWAQPIVAGGWRCGTGDVAFVILGFPIAAALVSGATGAGLWAARRERRWLGRFIALSATLAAAGSALAVAHLAPRLDRPQADAWVGTLPVVARLDHGAEDPRHEGREVRRLGATVRLERECRTWSDTGPASCAHRLRRVPDGSGIGGPVAGVAPCEPDGAALDCPGTHDLTAAPGGTTTVRHDRGLDLWIVETGGARARALGFDGDSLLPREVDTHRVGAAIAPPASWVALAAAGLGLALLALLGRLRLGWAALRLRGGREGRVEGDEIVFDDGELPARGALAHPVPEGPAVAWSQGRGDVGYRADGTAGAWRATPGHRGEQLEALRRRRTGCDAFALAVLLMTLTPLLVAARNIA